MSTTLHTPVCDLLGCIYPVLLAGMGGVARSELVAAVTNAGGFGFLGMVREQPELIQREIEAVRASTLRDFGVNLIPAATRPRLLRAELDTCIALEVPVVCLFWDVDAQVIALLRDAGVIVAHQVGSAHEAEVAQQAGAQLLIAQGIEAGGHVRDVNELANLIPAIVAIAKVPVVAAGGIVNGRGLVDALALGADGVMMGTAFLATTESFAHDYHKQRIVDAQGNVTLHTDAFHINWPAGAFVRVLPNSVTDKKRGDPHTEEKQVIGREGARDIYLFSTDSPLRSMTGDFEAMALYAGKGASEIESVIPAKDRLLAVVNEARALMANAASPSRAGHSLSSPVCYAATASENYMGFASTDEILALLDEVLSELLAASHVAMRSAAFATEIQVVAQLHAMRNSFSEQCAVLREQIELLQGVPRTEALESYRAGMTIATLPERMTYLQTKQAYCAEKIKKMLPHVRDDELYTALNALLVKLSPS